MVASKLAMGGNQRSVRGVRQMQKPRARDELKADPLKNLGSDLRTMLQALRINHLSGHLLNQRQSARPSTFDSISVSNTEKRRKSARRCINVALYRANEMIFTA